MTLTLPIRSYTFADRAALWVAVFNCVVSLITSFGISSWHHWPLHLLAVAIFSISTYIVCKMIFTRILIPLQLAAEYAELMAKGDHLPDLGHSPIREITKIYKALDVLKNSLTDIGSVCQSIAKGDLSHYATLGTGHDMLALAINGMIDHLKKAAEEESVRNWTNQGLASFSTLLRSDVGLTVLADEIISELVRNLQANQGAIFVVDDGNKKDVVLEMMACYAYNRKKYFNKSILPGEGLVGQCYLEGEYIYITHVPDDYITITSGLGQATPRAVLLMPLKYNDNIYGVLEIASFQQFKHYKIEFVSKIAESVASAIHSAKVKDQTRSLLEQSQLQTEMMRAQEEEMRQNMEELMATQEEMVRKNIENEAKTEMMNLIIDNIPFPVFIKDHEGKYTLVNDSEAVLLSSSKEQIIGADDTKFISDPQEIASIMASDKKVVEEQSTINFPEQKLTMPDGKSIVLKTSKIPFKNRITGKINILGVSVDLTKTKMREEELLNQINNLKEKLVIQSN